MMMQVLKDYERVSGQINNLSKSFMYLHEKTSVAVGRRLRRWTGIGQGQFPFTYLGCPIFYGRKKKEHCEGLVKKITGKILSWKSKLLTARGKYTLIKHALQSIPIYQLSAMCAPPPQTPKRVVKLIHKVIAKFFWG